MSRAALADAVRPFAPGGKLLGSHVPLIDALADALGLARADDGQRSALPPCTRTSPAGVALMHEFEGLTSKSYKDPGSVDGKPITNGRGSTRDLDGNPIKLGAVWTTDYSDRVFARDLADFEDDVARLIGAAPTSQGQWDAMVCLAYNIGVDAFGKSTLLRLHKAGDYAGAKAQFGRWNRNDGKVMAGLTRRRAAEAALYGAG